MKLLSHSNGVYKLEKDKPSKRKYLKNSAIIFLGLLLFGFLVQCITNIIDDSRLKSRFKYVRIDGNKMEYRLKTGGNCTVVFDGAIGNTMCEWDDICSSLEEKKVSTFTYNRRGYGFNDGLDIRTPEDQAKDLRNLLKKAGASQPYILVGEEYGSMVITNFINLYPDSVAGVVLIDPISEDTLKTKEFKDTIKSKYYRSKFEAIGSNYTLTSLLSTMGLTMENSKFKEHISESELQEFNDLENKKYYRTAVSNELNNLYIGQSDSQREGLLGKKPLYLITNKEDDPIKKIGNSADTVIYKEEIEQSPLSLLDSDAIETGVNYVLNEVKKQQKK